MVPETSRNGASPCLARLANNRRRFALEPAPAVGPGRTVKGLRLVEEAARNGLKTENADGLLDVAFSVAMSDQSALGLLVRNPDQTPKSFFPH
jgi:hypothetical protein